jgi:branched-chain amino acid transport system permease protein
VTLIYGILRFSNFAHGDTMAFGAMVTILVTWGCRRRGSRSARCPRRFWRCPSASRRTALLLLGTDRVVYRFYREQKAKPVIL